MDAYYLGYDAGLDEYYDGYYAGNPFRWGTLSYSDWRCGRRIAIAKCLASWRRRYSYRLGYFDGYRAGRKSLPYYHF